MSTRHIEAIDAAIDQPPLRRALLVRAAAASAALALAGASSPARAQAPPSTLGLYNVKDYGAVGDGVADDTAAAKAALAAALSASNGGILFFPSGRYKVTSTLSVTSQTPLEIVGAGFSSIILHAFDGNLIEWASGTLCNFCSVRDLQIQPVVTISSASAAIICQSGVQNSFFEGLLIRPANGTSPFIGSGIRMLGLTDTVSINNCFIWRVSGVGIEIGHGSEVRVLGGRVIGIRRSTLETQSIGIHITGNNGGVHLDSVDIIDLYEGCRVANSSGAGTNRELFVSQATFDGCFRGLTILDSSFVSIAGCWAASCDSDCIHVEFGGPTLVIAGGTIYNAGAFDSSDPRGANGITVNSGLFQITGVDIRGNRHRGVWVPNQAANNYTITSCRVRDNGVGADLIGNNYIVSNNIFSGNGGSNAFGGSGGLVNNNIGA